MNGNTLDFTRVVNCEVPADVLAESMKIDPVLEIFKAVPVRSSIDGIYTVKNGQSISHMDNMLGAVSYQLTGSGCDLYEYRFFSIIEDSVFMVVWINSSNLRFYKNGDTPDPIKLGDRICVFTKNFGKGGEVTSCIYDRQSYRNYFQGLVEAGDSE